MKTLTIAFIALSSLSALAQDCRMDRQVELYNTTKEFTELVEQKIDAMSACAPAIHLFRDVRDTQDYLSKALTAFEDPCGPKRLERRVNAARNRLRDFANSLHLEIGEPTDFQFIMINLEIGEAIIKE